MSTHKVTTTKHIDYDFDGEAFEWDGQYDIVLNGKIIGACAKDETMTYPSWGGHIITPAGDVQKMWTSRKSDIVAAAKRAWLAE